MKNAAKVLQIAFTYIGTVVGAGFATGQEILQFFTKYGKWGGPAILLATVLFIWLGTKMMLLAQKIKAESFEDLNRKLFGDRIGQVLSLFTMVVLIGVNSVMLAGAGSVFMEHFGLHYQIGLWVTLIFTFFLIGRGINGVMKLNSIVVPMMITLSLTIIFSTAGSPGASSFLTLTTDRPLFAAWASPLMYAAFNLSMAQAVLVPIGSHTNDRRAIVWGGMIGGLGVGFLLMAGHFALSAHMPGIVQFEIPMGNIARQLGGTIQFIYIGLIFMEIFSTFVADIYGVTLQIKQRLKLPPKLIVFGVLMICYVTSQFGFSSLLSVLYPAFGLFSLFWAVMLAVYRHGDRR
ncbi:YkvI family membrane protein [Paenibacillus sp. DYY-L-2]|uniref:YkvI family membrane protein n=1 Tax=Paenibacillus sp. DYY-L-2 TaxID=3447013 RepID=UPI003F4FB17B